MVRRRLDSSFLTVSVGRPPFTVSGSPRRARVTGGGVVIFPVQLTTVTYLPPSPNSLVITAARDRRVG